ncbi:hypothetical protein QBZ16_000090 [Prototheca wickerhamii]|uniref:Protein kinase domain-containing protein n=1 Tax=Prototheca wickerhamii TaxID=3111 RepID=A0AAD9MJP7_PROWI|nr:hypothetical protein QBZ16_000090 [Prototheca wickerhamii]
MRYEVLNYGAQGLDKKARKSFEAEERIRLGGRPDKGPRIPASIGVGMARKRSERFARAEEEGIASGMLDIHQLARKRRAEADAARERDPGLREDNGAFRHGVLRLNMGSNGSRGRRPSRGEGEDEGGAAAEEAAIKEIDLSRLSSKLWTSLQSEVAILRGIHHPNIVSLLDVIETHSKLFLVMEYCAGGDLSQFLRQNKAVSEATARSLLRQLAAGLREMWTRSLRDLKPQNLILSKAGPEAELKIADFGFARILQPQALPRSRSAASVAQQVMGFAGAPGWLPPGPTPHAAMAPGALTRALCAPQRPPAPGAWEPAGHIDARAAAREGADRALSRGRAFGAGHLPLDSERAPSPTHRVSAPIATSAPVKPVYGFEVGSGGGAPRPRADAQPWRGGSAGRNSPPLLRQRAGASDHPLDPGGPGVAVDRLGGFRARLRLGLGLAPARAGPARRPWSRPPPTRPRPSRPRTRRSGSRSRACCARSAAPRPRRTRWRATAPCRAGPPPRCPCSWPPSRCSGPAGPGRPRPSRRSWPSRPWRPRAPSPSASRARPAPRSCPDPWEALYAAALGWARDAAVQELVVGAPGGGQEASQDLYARAVTALRFLLRAADGVPGLSTPVRLDAEERDRLQRYAAAIGARWDAHRASGRVPGA